MSVFTSTLCSREDLAWAAGIFEGEGCISDVNTTGTKVQLAMTDRRALRDIRSDGQRDSPRH